MGTLPNSLFTGQVVGPFFKRPKITFSNEHAFRMSMVQAWSLRSLVEDVVASLLVSSNLIKAYLGRFAPRDALRALDFERNVRKLTIRLAAGKADGPLLTRFAAATSCLCSLRSLCDCFRAL